MDIASLIMGGLVGYILVLHMRIANLRDGLHEIHKAIRETIKLTEELKEKRDKLLDNYIKETESCKNS